MRWSWLQSDSISPRRNSSGCRATISRCALLEQNAALVLAAEAVLGEERRPRLRVARDDCDCGVAPPGDAHAVMRQQGCNGGLHPLDDSAFLLVEEDPEDVRARAPPDWTITEVHAQQVSVGWMLVLVLVVGCEPPPYR